MESRETRDTSNVAKTNRRPTPNSPRNSCVGSAAASQPRAAIELFYVGAFGSGRETECTGQRGFDGECSGEPTETRARVRWNSPSSESDLKRTKGAENEMQIAYPCVGGRFGGGLGGGAPGAPGGFGGPGASPCGLPSLALALSLSSGTRHFALVRKRPTFERATPRSSARRGQRSLSVPLSPGKRLLCITTRRSFGALAAPPTGGAAQQQGGAPQGGAAAHPDGMTEEEAIMEAIRRSLEQ